MNLMFLSPVLVALSLAMLLLSPLNILAAFFCYSVGLLSLVSCKASLFRRGIWISFGPAQLAPEYRRSYWIGYAWIAAGVVLNVVVLLTSVLA